MTEGDSLSRAILAEPGDDLLRLVYADWLDDAGEPERAALIRVQIQLAASPTPELREAENVLLGPVGHQVWQRRREWALPVNLRDGWPEDIGGWEWVRGFPEVWHTPLGLWEAWGPEIAEFVPVSRVVLIGREPQPSLTNPRKPERTWFRDDANWVTRPEDGSLLPPDVFDLLEPDALDMAMFAHARTYPCRGDALTAVSEACLRIANASRPVPV